MKKAVKTYQEAHKAYEADRSQENSDALTKAHADLLAINTDDYPDDAASESNEETAEASESTEAQA